MESKFEEPLLPKTNDGKPPQPPQKSQKWILYALLAGLCLGYGNFFVARIESTGGFAISYVGLVAYLILIGYRLSQSIKNKAVHGTFINYRKSNFFDQYQQFKWKQLVPLLGNGLTNLMNLVSMVYAFQFAQISGINQGVILTLNALAAVYNIIIFYLVFKEKVTYMQFSGICLMLLCVVLLNINGQSRPESEDGVNKRYYAFLSLACGLASPFFLSMKHIFIRSYKSQYATWDMAIDGLILEYQLYIILAIYYLSMVNQINWHDLLYGSLASLFLVIGKTCIAIAVAEGIAGAATSLCNTQVLHMTFLTVMFAAQGISQFEIWGVICGITGAVIISTGDLLIKKFKK